MLNVRLMAFLVLLSIPACFAQDQDRDAAAIRAQLEIDKQAPAYNRNGENLLAMLRARKSNDNTLSITYAPPGRGIYRIVTFEESWTKGVCDADLIVVGTVRLRKASLSSTESALVTDYLFDVTNVLKSKTPLQSPLTQIFITSRGGILRTADGIIEEKGDVSVPLAPGETYLLFLERFGDNGSFEVPSAFPTFKITATEVLPMAPQWFTESLSRFVAPITVGTLQQDVEMRSRNHCGK